MFPIPWKLVGMAAAIVLIVVGFNWMSNHFEEIGYAKAKAEYNEALEKTRITIQKLRDKHAEEQRIFSQKLAQARSAHRAKVVATPEVAAWWATPIPRAAVEYAYGMRPDDRESPLRTRSGNDPGR